jgi:hypothetical protein
MPTAFFSNEKENTSLINPNPKCIVRGKNTTKNTNDFLYGIGFSCSPTISRE